MTNRDAERLRRINAFPQLVAYLRDELQWPFVEFDDPEEIAFDWSAEELGIEGKHAAAIEEIRQLQPPEGDWPWGIFYVKFEKKRLPITILRRALASVVRKKRATANTGQRWDLEDLLFISSYGEGEKRQISFARFQAPEGTGSRLPVLKVLAWDEDDTDLSLEHTAGELRARLVWPDDTSDVAAWRSQWGSAFTRGHRETIESSKDLARELAGLAQRIRDRITQVLSLENEAGPLRGLMEAFRSSLVHDLDEPGFADMYAQTIAYGLFSARVTNPESGDAGSLLSVPVTNPFLDELLGTFLEVGGRDCGGPGIDFDELGVNDVVDLLDDTDMEAVLRDFGDKNPLEDPVIHFFEGFLGEYDKKIKKDRGVFYTPRPVVSFIVRSVDELLRTEFGLEDGLADTTTWGEMAGRIDDLEIPEGATETQAFVQILDPATGTGTFLVEVVDLIYKTMTAKWQAERYAKKKIEELWNAYVPEHLLPRLHGYELMMAPYAIAHMKVGLKLYETGYRFESDERARVYLTNALEPTQDFSGTLAFAIPALAHEAEAVNAIKRDQRFTVVIGNPPYSRHSSNPSRDEQGELTFIGRLIEDYKDGCPELQKPAQAKYLQDDYVKFLRFCSLVSSRATWGILGFITNHGFLDNPTFRGVRKHLLETYPKLSVIDLHGNANKGERCPDGSPDKNVFDIRQGVSITLGARSFNASDPSFSHGDLWGSRQDKYKALGRQESLPAVAMQAVEVEPPDYLLCQRDSTYEGEYRSHPSLREIFSPSGDPAPGILTTHDAFAVAFSREEIASNIDTLLAASDEQEARASFKLCSQSQWDYSRATAELSRGGWRDEVIPLYYRPFDVRFTVYNSNVAVHLRSRLTRHLLGGDNVAIITSRMTKGEDFRHAQVTRLVPEVICMSPKTSNNGFVFPLWLKSEGSLLAEGRVHNFGRAYLGQLCAALSVEAGPEDGLPMMVSAEEVFGYLYALLYSPGYRQRYSVYLKSDFPRVPLPRNLDLFRDVASLGRELVATQLLESLPAENRKPIFVESDDPQVEKVSYSDETVWIDRAKMCGFKGVPEEVWNFHIGGYQVCKKWLKDRQPKGGQNPRPGRVLTDEDIEHYQKIVVALAETIRIMAEVDEIIEAHGGWPGAFVTDTGSESGDVELGGASLAADAPVE